jgi:hypothetical protein
MLNCGLKNILKIIKYLVAAVVDDSAWSIVPSCQMRSSSSEGMAYLDKYAF